MCDGLTVSGTRCLVSAELVSIIIGLLRARGCNQKNFQMELTLRISFKRSVPKWIIGCE